MNVNPDVPEEELTDRAESIESARIRKRFEIIRLARCGKTGHEVAAKLGISRRRVHAWIARFNLFGIEGLLETNSKTSVELDSGN